MDDTLGSVEFTAINNGKELQSQIKEKRRRQLLPAFLSDDSDSEQDYFAKADEGHNKFYPTPNPSSALNISSPGRDADEDDEYDGDHENSENAVGDGYASGHENAYNNVPSSPPYMSDHEHMGGDNENEFRPANENAGVWAIAGQEKTYPASAGASGHGECTHVQFAPQSAQQMSFTIRSPLSNVALVRLPKNGHPVTIGRSSKSSDVAVSRVNKLISRVHAKVHISKPENENENGYKVNIECLGWNGLVVCIPDGHTEYKVGRKQTLSLQYVGGITLAIHGERALLELVNDDVNDETEEEEPSFREAGPIFYGSEKDVEAAIMPIREREPSPIPIRIDEQDYDDNHMTAEEPAEELEVELAASNEPEITLARDENKVPEEGSRNQREEENEQPEQEPSDLVTQDKARNVAEVLGESTADPEKTDETMAQRDSWQAAARETEPAMMKTDTASAARISTESIQSSELTKPASIMTEDTETLLMSTKSASKEPVEPAKTEQGPAVHAADTETENLSGAKGAGAATDKKKNKPQSNSQARSRSHTPDVVSSDKENTSVNRQLHKKRKLEHNQERQYEQDDDSLSEEEVRNIGHVVANHLAFSRLSQTPLSYLSKNIGALANVSRQNLREVLAGVPCIGVIHREGKDAAGKPLEEEYYYLPEKDEDESRRCLVEQARGGNTLRSCRRTHKQYYWKKPPPAR